nr:hypothetical protein [Tanacetum cinerariifolium]
MALGDPPPSRSDAESGLALGVRKTCKAACLPRRLLARVCLAVSPVRWLQKVRRPWYFLSLICISILLSLPPLRKAVEEYDIPSDLHPRLPRLAGTDGVNRVILFKIRCSLKGYDDHDVARLSEFLVPLRPPSLLLYVCGLTTICRHSELRYDIKDQDKNVIDMDTFLKLPSWTGTVVSRGDPILEDQRPKPRVTPPLGTGVKIPKLTAFQKSLEKSNPKIAAAREKKEQQSLAKAEAKRAGAGGAEGPKKKQNVQKHRESIQSGSEEILSVIPLHQATPETTKNPTLVVDVTQGTSHVEKEVVDLSGNTCVPTPPAATVPPSPRAEHHDTQEHAASDAHSSQSSHQGHEDEPVNNQYVPNWGLRNDLRVCTFRACRELVSHLATPAEDDFLGNISNVEVISRVYLTMRQSVLAQGELLKRHEQLSHDYVDLVKGSDANFTELHRATASDQVEKIRRLKKDLEPRTQQLKVAAEKIGGLERKKLALSAKVAQAEADLQQLVREFIPAVVKRFHASVEYKKSLAAPDLDIEGLKLYEAKHRELFTMSYPYVQKVADSYGLSMTELLKISSEVPSSVDEETASSAAAEEASKKPPSSPSKVAFKTPFGTTT